MSTVAQEDERLDILVHGQPLAREKRQLSPLERALQIPPTQDQSQPRIDASAKFFFELA